MKKHNLAVAVFDSHEKAEEAVRALNRAGIDMKTISIIGKDYHSEEHVIGYFNAGERAKFFGKYGAFWGGLAGMLFGSALLFVPVVGHFILLGPIAATLAGGVEGAVLGGGVSAIVGALTALGVPKDSVLRYETALKANNFVVIVNGDSREVDRARDIIQSLGAVADRHEAKVAEPA
ncbi:MAG: DUF1269 domain-containing protein [Betaproteobacteria bacterium]|nr:DUF1269 domain-containing protein [Betaproteobacteria bacterium]